jgi:hypothetical protein
MTAIDPKEANRKKSASIPKYVLDAFNELIVANLKDGIAEVGQEEAIDLIMKKAPAGTTRNSLFDRNYLDVEEAFEAAGWKVEYDKPGYCEEGEASFTFRAKRVKRRSSR